MILYSTLDRLIAEKKDIYRVTVAAYVIKRGALCSDAENLAPETDTPQTVYRDYFATKAQATHHAAQLDAFNVKLGGPVAVIDTVPAHWDILMDKS